MQLKRCITLLLFSFLLSIAGKSAADQSSEPTQVSLHSIQADFVQEKHLKILKQPIISTGTFTFQRPQSLRWEYKNPIRSILLLHDGKVQKFVEREGHLLTDEGMQFGSMQVVLTEISNWLEGNFTENTLFNVLRPSVKTVRLTPKNKELAGLISSIELTLADQQGNLDEIIIYEGADSYTRMRFGNRVLNEEVPVSVFTRP